MSLETPGGAEGQTLCPFLQHEKLGSPGCSSDTDKPLSLEEMTPGQGHEQHSHQGTLTKKSIVKKTSTFNSGLYKEHLEKSVCLGKFQRSAVEVTPLLKFCTCRITPAWRSHSFGACMVPPEIPAGKLLQKNCRRVSAEPKTMGLAWEWL